MAKVKVQPKTAEDTIARMRAVALAEYDGGEQAKYAKNRLGAFQRAYSNFLELAQLGDSMSAGYLGLMYKKVTYLTLQIRN